MEEEALLSFAANVGRELLESGAETSRVEDTLKRIIRHFYDGDSEVFVVMTGFFVNVGMHTKTVRVRYRTINLDRVSKINMLSRDIAADKASFTEAHERLLQIEQSKPYPQWLRTAATAVCCGFFTLLFDGNVYDALNSFIVGAAVNLLAVRLRKIHTSDFIVTSACGAVIALISSALYAVGLGSAINSIITGAIMPLVPGLGITNALRDIMAGDYLSGGARLFDALVVAIALAAGAASVMYFLGHITGGVLK